MWILHIFFEHFKKLPTNFQVILWEILYTTSIRLKLWCKIIAWKYITWLLSIYYTLTNFHAKYCKLNTIYSHYTSIFLFEISLTACNIAKDCYTCLSQDDNFDCKWCQKVKRCSDGIDWLRQEWRDQGCEIQVHRGLFLCCRISVCDSILKLTNIFFCQNMHTSRTIFKKEELCLTCLCLLMSNFNLVRNVLKSNWVVHAYLLLALLR